MRNHDLNSSSDFEAGPKTVITDPKPFLLRPPLIQTNNEKNYSTVENRQFVDNEKVNQSLFNDEVLKKSNSENNDLNEFGDCQNEDDQYNKFNDNLFTLMYPQLSLFNILHSPESSPVRIKPTISITEITSEDELNDFKNMKNNCEFNESFTDDVFNFSELKIENEKESYKGNSRINPFNGKNTFITEFVDKNLGLGISPTECNIFGMNYTINNLDDESPLRNISNVSIDSEEDSDLDTSLSESMESSDSSNLGKNATLKRQSTSKRTEVLTTKKIPEELSGLKSPAKNMEYINRQLSMIDEEIKLLPPSSYLDRIDYSVGTEIENQMAERFESLQKEISTFLERTVKFEDHDNLLSVVDQEQNKPKTSYITSPNTFQAENNIINSELINKEYCHRSPNTTFLKSAGDNINLDQLLTDSTDPSSFSWPYHNIDIDHEPLIQSATEHNSNSIDYPKDSFAISSDIVNRTENFEPTDEDRQITFPLENTQQLIDSSSTNLVSDSINFPFTLSTKSEDPKQEFDQSQSEESKEAKNDNIESIEDDISITPKNQSNDDFQDSSIGLDDSQSSIDIYMNRKFDQQTNKNAVSAHDSEPLHIHHFRGGTVQDAVRLFENVVVHKREEDLKSQIKSLDHQSS